jgi:N-acetylmuramoyl-L-alanine amidase
VVAAHPNNSDILFVVLNRKSFVITLAVVLVSGALLDFRSAGAAAAQQPQATALPAPAPAPAQEAPPPASSQTSATPQAQAPSAPASAPVPAGPVIVLDPAHGGTDMGARGESATEKDVVLQIARTVRAALERQGYRVILTRNDDSNPSYDDRAAVANAFRDSIFISLHASSTGTPGTVRAYSMRFAAPAAAFTPAADVTNAPAAPSRPAPPVALTGWEDAQRPYLAGSRRLAQLIQNEFSQSFAGSPAVSEPAPVRALRSVTGPAVAVEISSVSAETPDALNAAADPLGNAIARAVSAFRQSAATAAGGAK